MTSGWWEDIPTDRMKTGNRASVMPVAFRFRLALVAVASCLFVLPYGIERTSSLREERVFLVVFKETGIGLGIFRWILPV